MGRDNRPLYVQPRSPSTQPPLNEQLRRQRDDFGPFTRLLLSVLLQSRGQAHYQIKDDTGITIPHLLMSTSSTNFQAVKQEESQPKSMSSHALDVDATSPFGDGCGDPYRDDGFFASPQSSPPPLSDPPHKRRVLNIFQVDMSTRLQGCLKQSVSIFRVPSDTLSQAFANGKPPTRRREGKVETGNKDEGRDDISDTFVGVVETYSQQSSSEQVRFRLFKWSHRRSKEGMEAHERLPTVVDVPYAHFKPMYYTATQVKLKAEKEKEKEKERKREARKKKREGKKRNDRNVVTSTNNSSDTQATDTQQSAQPSQASPPSESQTIGIASHVDAAVPVTYPDETTPRAGCWTCFRFFICGRV